MKLRIITAVLFSIGAIHLANADEVWVKGREKTVSGTVGAEDAKGIMVKGISIKAVPEFIPVNEIVDILYSDIKPSTQYKAARTAEKEALDALDPDKRKSATTRAINAYADTLKEMTPHKSGKRMIEYKIATLTLRQAQETQTPTATGIAKLKAFKNAYPNSWQISLVVPLIAQAQFDANEYEEAAQTYQEMADLEVLPQETRINASIEVVRVLVRGNKIAEAQKKLDALAARSASNPVFASRVKMARAEVLIGQKNTKDALPILQQVIKENNDRTIKAMAHNALGECYFKDSKFNDAMWEFLWVDTVFNQDRNEHARALYYLWKTFENLSIAERAQECREMLLNDKAFAGTEYQARGAKEAK